MFSMIESCGLDCAFVQGSLARRGVKKRCAEKRRMGGNVLLVLALLKSGDEPKAEGLSSCCPFGSFVCLFVVLLFWKEDTLVFYVIVIEFWSNCFANFQLRASKLAPTRGLVPFVHSDLLSNGSNCEGEKREGRCQDLDAVVIVDFDR